MIQLLWALIVVSQRANNGRYISFANQNILSWIAKFKSMIKHTFKCVTNAK